MLTRAALANVIDSGTKRRRMLCLTACLLLFAASLWRYRIVYNPTLSISDQPEETWHLANNLRTTGHFANPFSTLDTGPSAHSAPVFPAFLALVTTIFGTQSVGVYAYQFAAILVGSLLLGSFPILSSLLGMGALNGVVAACIWLAARPPLFPDWETTYASLLIAIATGGFRWLLSSKAPRTTITFLVGFVMGLLALLIPTCVPVLICWLIGGALSRQVSLFRSPGVILLIVPAMMVLPWTVRNYLVFDQFILVRDDIGEALSVSNNDCAAFGIVANHLNGCYQTVHPNESMVEAKKVLAMGEVRYNEVRLEQFRDWLADHPKRFISLCLERIAAFWLPHEKVGFTGIEAGRGKYYYLVYAMTLLSTIGLWVTARRDMKSAMLCASWLCVFPIIYYVVQFEDRYRYPIMWVTFLLGSVPLTLALRWPYDRLFGGFDRAKTINGNATES